MLEFLRTGKLAGITCGCTAEDVLSVFGAPDWKTDSWFRYDSFEVWFDADTRIVYRLTLQRFRGYFGRQKHSHSFQQAIPQITRAKVDPWVIREGLGLEATKRFLKTAHFKYQQSRWKIGTDQLELESGVCLLFEPTNSPWGTGLCFVEIAPEHLSPLNARTMETTLEEKP